jgi:hypothetical protein
MNRIVLFLCLLFGTVLAKTQNDEVGKVEEFSLCGTGLDLKDGRYDNRSGYDIEMDGDTKPVRVIRDIHGNLKKIEYPTYEYTKIINVTVKVIIVRGDQGEVNSLNKDSVKGWIEKLNKIFNVRGGITFSLQNVTETKNTKISNKFDHLANPLNLIQEKKPKTLTIVVANDFKRGFLGAAYFPWHKAKADAVYIQAKYMPPAIESVAVLAHEVGHWFGLHHTFHNSCSGTNDLITDTNPGRIAYLSLYKGKCKTIQIPDEVKCFKPNQEAATYPITNFMSYGPLQCQNMFTTKQFLRMRDMYAWRETGDGPSQYKIY